MTSPAPAAAGQSLALPVYGRVEDWVSGHFTPLFRRPLGGQYRWCPSWDGHLEAVSRLTALWRAWEACRIEPGTGMADWYGQHLDHHLPILLGPDGPFAQCDPDGGHLELKPFPAGPDRPAAPGPDNAPGVEEPVFLAVGDWVRDYFIQMFRRPLGGQYRWCPSWDGHLEAVSRLTALWQTWETFRLEPATGISDWYGQHLDHHLPILLGPAGPFAQCDPDGGHLEIKPFPEGPDAADRSAAHAAAGDDGGRRRAGR